LGLRHFHDREEIPVLKFQTSLGSFTVELNEADAPITCKNFLDYVAAGHFDGTVFHRVIPNFVIQGGGLTADMTQKKTRAPIKNESSNGLKNRRGTLSMARTNDPNSATSQFFVNLKDNAFLDPGPGNPGYAVFGFVSEGMSVVDKIAAVQTGRKGFHEDVPLEPVVVESVTVAEG
jgi:cyclophilin family peptidyl-prolyl cis-trans isomerase